MRLQSLNFTAVLCFALTAIWSWSGAPATAGILDLDFTSDGSGNAAAFGGGPVIGTAPGFTPFVVAELGPAANTTLNPSVTVSGVTFALQGSVNAWPGRNALDVDVLMGDYLFFGNADGVLGVSPSPFPWSVTGLAPNSSYELTFTHGENSGNAIPDGLGGRSLQIDSGASSLTVSSLLGDRVKTLTLFADGAGAIDGTFTGLGFEGNLAALSIRVPEPGSIALLGLGCFGLLLAVRKPSP